MQKLLAKAAGVFVAVALLVGVAVPTANALTASEITALLVGAGIDAETAATLAAVLGTSGSSSSSSSSSAVCASYTRDLTMGSTGSDVVSLQTVLEDLGYLSIPVGVSKGYFGSLTQSALASMQADYGISPAAGYFGPITRSAFSDLCAQEETVVVIPGDDDDDSSSSDLQGEAGSVDEYDLDNSYNNEEVGEDESDVEVAGLEIEAEDDSDLLILAVKLDFTAGTAGSASSDDDLDEYAEEVSIWYDGDKVAEVDADKFDDDNNYQSTVTLDEDVIIEAGDTGTLVVAVSGISNLDSANEGKTWTVDFTQVRWQDAQGTVISEDPGTGTETFSFESFASAVDLEVTFDEDDESVNESHVIDIDDNNDEDDVPLLSFEIEVEGDSSVTMDDLPVTVTSAGGNIDDIVSAFSLVYDGDDVGSENSSSLTGTSGTLTFDDLDLDLDEGTHSFLVNADILATTTEGNTISVDITSANADAADIEDETGEDVDDSDVEGSADGEAHALYTEGIMVEFVSKDNEKIFTADESGEKDRVQFDFTFDVTAFGDDMYIDKDTVATSSPSNGTDGIAYATTSQSSGTSTISSASISADDTDTNDTATQFIVDENDTREFTLSVVVEAGQDGQVQLELTGIAWGDTGAGDTDADQMYTFNLDEFLSSVVSTNIQ